MQQVVEMAEKLGKAIAETPQAARMRAAREALDKDKAASQLLKDYHAQAEKIARLEQEQKPVEVDDKHKLQDLHDRLVASEVFKSYTSAQVEYVDLMRRVSQAMRGQLRQVEGE